MEEDDRQTHCGHGCACTQQPRKMLIYYCVTLWYLKVRDQRTQWIYLFDCHWSQEWNKHHCHCHCDTVGPLFQRAAILKVSYCESYCYAYGES